MAGKTKVNGTAYTIGGGKTKIGGTVKTISKGITKIGGTAKTIKFSRLPAGYYKVAYIKGSHSSSKSSTIYFDEQKDYSYCTFVLYYKSWNRTQTDVPNIPLLYLSSTNNPSTSIINRTWFFGFHYGDSTGYFSTNGNGTYYNTKLNGSTSTDYTLTVTDNGSNVLATTNTIAFTSVTPRNGHKGYLAFQIHSFEHYFYKLKVSKYGNLIHNVIPISNGTNVGFYDTVGEQFMQIQDSSFFVAGDPV